MQSSDGSGVAKATAKCFIKLMTDSNIMMYAAFLRDVLSVLQVMSKGCQRENGTAADIHRSLNTTKQSLAPFHQK